jgi:hypothetical protein
MSVLGLQSCTAIVTKWNLSPWITQSYSCEPVHNNPSESWSASAERAHCFSVRPYVEAVVSNPQKLVTKLAATANDWLVSTQTGFHITLQKIRYKTSKFYNFLTICFFTFIFVYLIQVYALSGGRNISVGITTGYGLDGPGIESRWERDFSHLSIPGPGAHSGSCTIGIGSFSEVESDRGVTLILTPFYCRGLKTEWPVKWVKPTYNSR